MRQVAWIGAMFALGCCTRGKVQTETASGPSAAPVTDKKTVIATVNGETITAGDLEKALGSALRKKQREVYELKRQKLEEMIVQKLVAAEAKKNNQTENEYLKQKLDAKIVAPTEMDAKAFYEQNKDEIKEPFENVKDKILMLLKQEREQQIALQLFKGLREAGKVEVALPEPEEPKVEVAAVGPARGPENAPVTIVEFSDFQCPFCQRAAGTVGKVIADYAGKVRLVYRQFPLEFHDKAFKAAEAGLCANEQGKFWEMHDQMFGDQQHLDVPGLKKGARSVGLDGDKFDSCLDSGRFEAQVKKDMADGQAVGVDGTPAFFINGHMLSGAQPAEAFRDLIEKELKAKPN